ncbi:hypothetical protein HanPI659440_Chr01g0009521 [Helianthus annuus]|nr:hypothetical protein HanPI659440_Chr01g0009521 [Helianthus annuus]
MALIPICHTLKHHVRSTTARRVTDQDPATNYTEYSINNSNNVHQPRGLVNIIIKVPKF